MARPCRSACDRFWVKVDIRELEPGGCWFWVGATGQRGHGRFRDGSGRMVQAHRWSYEALVGPIPEGLQIDHLCRNPACVNPDHMEPVTSRENTLRGFGPAALAARTVQCPRGHRYDEANTYVDRVGKRHCRACGRAAAKARYWATRGEVKP